MLGTTDESRVETSMAHSRYYLMVIFSVFVCVREREISTEHCLRDVLDKKMRERAALCTKDSPSPFEHVVRGNST